MPPVSIDQARRAKLQVKALVGDDENVVGIGVTKVKGGYAVKVNLRARVPATQVPASVDGVPVVSEVVGSIRARTAAKPPR